MEQKRSYRRRGSPDLPISVYFVNAQAAGANPIPEYHPEWELVRITQGHLVLQLGGESKTFRQGDIFLIPGNTVHNYRFFSEDAKYCCLIFSPAAIAMTPDHFFQKTFVTPMQEGRLQLPGLLQPGHPVYDSVIAQFDILPNAHMFTQDYQARRFSALMNICLLLLPYSTVLSENRPPLDPGNSAVRACMRYIHSYYNTRLTLEALAGFCHLHPNYLCALFKNYTGQTLFEYIARFRVETAAQLLKEEPLSIGKVAELVGFHSESHFYQKFKQIMGVSPKTYARQQKNA